MCSVRHSCVCAVASASKLHSAEQPAKLGHIGLTDRPKKLSNPPKKVPWNLKRFYLTLRPRLPGTTPNSWIFPKSIGEGASSLLGGQPGSPENVSCSRATPRLHRCKSGVALEQETFSGLPGHPPKRLLRSFSCRFRGNPGIRGLCQAIGVANLTPF